MTKTGISFLWLIPENNPFSIFSTNFSTSSFMTLACADNSSDAAADSSAVAEEDCTTEEICCKPSFKDCIPSDSFLADLEICSISLFTLSVLSETDCKDSAVSSVIFAPFCTASMVSSINSPVFCAAFADFCARFPTSSATTAKPFPAAPARAASMAALRDKIFV